MCLCNGKNCFCKNLCSSVFVIVVFCLGLFMPASGEMVRIKRESLDDVQHYLSEFGYLKKSKDGAFALRTEHSIRKSLSEMQEFAGLPVTGQLDERTLKLIRTPRCGLPDKEDDDYAKRRKRFAIRGQKWPYTNLTWSVRTKQFDNLNWYEVRHVMSKALEVWSKPSQLNFREVNSDKADILIYFYRGDHGDSFPFDGRGVVLAHAFFPTGTRSSVQVHFDADEIWTTTGNKDDSGTNLFNVAAHEIGHSLGLSHSSVETALMYPWYKEIENGFDYELPDDDKQAIQYLYGARDNRRVWETNPRQYRPVTTPTTTTTTTTTKTTTKTTTTTRRRPRITRPPRIPYIPQYPNGVNTYYTTHKPYYDGKYPMHPKQKPQWTHRNTDHKTERTPHKTHPDQGYPKVYPTRNPDKYLPTTTRRHTTKHNPPKESPPGKSPPNTCDTSYDAVSVIRREVFIFKDAYFWRIGENGLMPGYPAEIKRLWHGLPDNLDHVDAVYERSDGRIVFFIGNRYYVFLNNEVEGGYPKPLTHLGLPRKLQKVDGAMVWGHNGKTYFYSGNDYWKFDEDSQKVELDYPRNMAMWKGVGSNIDAVFQWKDGKTYFFKGNGFWKFNDLHMRVEHIEPKQSAPFWMGCTTNYEENDLGQKLPYIHETTSNGIPTSPSTTVILLLLVCFYFNFLS